MGPFDTMTVSQIRQLLSQKADTKKVMELINALLDQIGAGEEPPTAITTALVKDTPLSIVHNRHTTDIAAAFFVDNDVLLVDYYPNSPDTILVTPHNTYPEVRVIIY